mgnify:CR=1 FL=1|jgi:uncharacterized membrane protein YidH (DUF202 family)
MHFVICAFIAFICLVTAILFTEVFPKWLKAFLALLGAATSGYAISIFIRKVAIWTKAFAKPDLLPVAGIAAVVMLVIIIIVTVVLNKKKAK